MPIDELTLQEVETDDHARIGIVDRDDECRWHMSLLVSQVHFGLSITDCRSRLKTQSRCSSCVVGELLWGSCELALKGRGKTRMTSHTHSYAPIVKEAICSVGQMTTCTMLLQ